MFGFLGGKGNLPGKVGAPDPAVEKRKYLLQTYKHLYGTMLASSRGWAYAVNFVMVFGIRFRNGQDRSLQKLF